MNPERKKINWNEAIPKDTPKVIIAGVGYLIPSPVHSQYDRMYQAIKVLDLSVVIGSLQAAMNIILTSPDKNAAMFQAAYAVLSSVADKGPDALLNFATAVLWHPVNRQNMGLDTNPVALEISLRVIALKGLSSRIELTADGDNEVAKSIRETFSSDLKEAEAAYQCALENNADPETSFSTLKTILSDSLTIESYADIYKAITSVGSTGESISSTVLQRSGARKVIADFVEKFKAALAEMKEKQKEQEKDAPKDAEPEKKKPGRKPKALKDAENQDEPKAEIING
jgi:hypothetical protein